MKPNGWCSRPSALSAVGVRPNSPPQRTSVSLSRPRALRSCQQAGDGPVGRGAVVRQLRLEAAVLVPELAARPLRRDGVIDLHAAHAALHQPAGQQALLAERLGRLVVQAVELLRRPAIRRSRSNASGASVCIRKASSNDAMRALSWLSSSRCLRCRSLSRWSASSWSLLALRRHPADFSDWRWGCSGRRRACPGRRRAGSWNSTAGRPAPAATG